MAFLYVSYGVNTTPGCSPNCDNEGPYGPNAGQIWAYTMPKKGNKTGTWDNITPPQTTPTGGAYGLQFGRGRPQSSQCRDGNDAQ